MGISCHHKVLCSDRIMINRNSHEVLEGLLGVYCQKMGAEFKNGRIFLKVDPRGGRPKPGTTGEDIGDHIVYLKIRFRTIGVQRCMR